MRTTAEIVIDTVLEWGIDTIFGIPGDGINGVMEAIRKRQADKKLRFRFGMRKPTRPVVCN